MRRLFFALLLVASLAAAPAAAQTDGNETTTETPAETPGDDLTAEQAAERLRERLRAAAAGVDVPDAELRRLTEQVGDDRAREISRSVAAELESVERDQLLERVDGLGSWAGGLAAGVIQAETANAATPTPEPTPVERRRNVSDDPRRLRVDGTLTVATWTYQDGMFRITFENDGPPTTATLSESTQPEEGSSRFNIRRQEIMPGTTTVTFRARSYEGSAAVSITTRQSIEMGRGVVISTGRLNRNPFSHYGGTSGVLSGTGMSMMLGFGAAAFVIWREDSGVVKA